MADISIDLERLEALQRTMHTVRREFDEAEEFSQAVAGLVGHDQLANTVRDFATQWNLRRHELLEELDYIAQATKSIHDTMVELDQELSTVVSNYRPNHSSGGGGGGGGGGGR
ncbi:MAG: hypothetical protein ABJA94_04315 [Rhodoglobus sp.]